MKKIIKEIYSMVILFWLKITSPFRGGRPPRILNYHHELNADILRMFGADISRNNIRILSPVTLHSFIGHHLTIKDNCLINGNNFLDLSAPITLEEGASLGPGVIIMTHNNYNVNDFLKDRLAHTVGKKGVLIKKGAGIKAGALVVMGVTIGENAVVGGNAVVNRDVADNTFVAGVPAKIIKQLK